METKINKEVKQPVNFEWTDEKVAEVSKIITKEYNNSKIWSGDNSAELNIIRKYKFDKIIHEKIKCLNTISLGNESIVAVDYKKLEELIKYLSDYQAELQSL